MFKFIKKSLDLDLIKMYDIHMDDFDIVVIGGGPGGYVAAIESARLGFNTALIEKDTLGGTCLNRGCIPSKSLLKSAEIADELLNKSKKRGFNFDNLTFDYKKIVQHSKTTVRRLKSGLNTLLSNKDISILEGHAKFKDSNTLEIESSDSTTSLVSAKQIIISTGSTPYFPEDLKPDGELIVDSDYVLNSDTLPNKICIIGGGYIGIEFAYFYSSFGIEVSIVESEESILSSLDSEISIELKKSYEKRGIKIFESSAVKEIINQDSMANIILSNQESDIIENVDKVLVSTGRIPNTSGLNLKSAGVKTDKFGFIKVDNNFRTNIDNIFAIGDVIGGLMLAHKASEEGFLLINEVININKDLSDKPLVVPACIYCQPEISYIGITEDLAKTKKIPYKVGKYPFKANGKSLAGDETLGFCKILADKNDKILGAHIIGKGATEMISEISLIMSNNLSLKSITNTIHPHPTLSEIIFESTHILNKTPRNY